MVGIGTWRSAGEMALFGDLEGEDDTLCTENIGGTYVDQKALDYVKADV